MDRAAGPFSPTLHTQDSPSAPNMSVMCVFMRHVRRNKVSPRRKHESSAHQENVLHVWWKCTWFQFISSEDINVFIYKPGEGLDDERDPSEPQMCFSFRFPRCSLIYWHIYAAQFISVLGRLQFVQITLHFGFNLLRAADGWICDDRRSSNANSSQRSAQEEHFVACFFRHIIVLRAGRSTFQMLSDLHLEECLGKCWPVIRIKLEHAR